VELSFAEIVSKLIDKAVLIAQRWNAGALRKNAALPPDICAFGDSLRIVFRRSRSTFGIQGGTRCQSNVANIAGAA